MRNSQPIRRSRSGVLPSCFCAALRRQRISKRSPDRQLLRQISCHDTREWSDLTKGQMMSHEESVSREDFPQRWPQVETGRAWWKHFRINLLIVLNSSRWFLLILLPLLFVTAGWYEARTSAIEAKLLSAIAAKLSYSIGPG